MSALPQAPEVRTPEDVLAEALHPAEVYPDGIRYDGQTWEIESRGAAEWAVAKIRQAERAYADATAPSFAAIEALKAEIAVHEAFIAAKAAKAANTVQLFETKLAHWLRRTYEAEAAANVHPDKRTKSIKLPYRTIKRNPPRPSVLIADTEAFCETHGDESDFVKVERKPVLSAVLEYAKSHEGELPDGASIDPGEPSYTVVVTEGPTP